MMRISLKNLSHPIAMEPVHAMALPSGEILHLQFGSCSMTKASAIAEAIGTGLFTSEGEDVSLSVAIMTPDMDIPEVVAREEEEELSSEPSVESADDDPKDDDEGVVLSPSSDLLGKPPSEEFPKPRLGRRGRR